MEGTDLIPKNAAVLFVADRSTRLDTLLFAYAYYKWAVSIYQASAPERDISLFANERLFKGAIGSFLRKNPFTQIENSTSKNLPVVSLLEGKPCALFPERPHRAENALPQTAYVGERKSGTPQIMEADDSLGAAALAMRVETIRRALEFSHDDESKLTTIREAIGLSPTFFPNIQRTVIVPIRITYYPIRSRENLFLRFAFAVAKDPSKRAIEDLSVENSPLSKETDVSITFGEPIDVTERLEQPENRSMQNLDPAALDILMQNSDSAPTKLEQSLNKTISAAIANAVTINPDHILASLVRNLWGARFTDQGFRHRAFLATNRISAIQSVSAHPAMAKFKHELLHEDSGSMLESFIKLCVDEHVLDHVGKRYWRLEPSPWTQTNATRPLTLVDEIANEIESLSPAIRIIQETASTPAFINRRKLRKTLMEEDRKLFEADYAAHFEAGVSKESEVGRPFLMRPFFGLKGGVVLIHGYMAAPLEVRMMADYLRTKGYAVYAVRLRGHGTSPADLSTRTWEDWFASIEQGCAVIETMTDNLIVGGFSMGAGLALLTAGKKNTRIKAVFAIDAPMYLRSAAARFAPSIVRVNALLKRVRWGRMRWEYVENSPENKHINYFSNPVSGVAELTKAMHRAFEVLTDISAPTLLMQGSKDPLVSPESAPATFEKIGSPDKLFTILERNRHGIINGEGAEEVFSHINLFLTWAKMKNRERK
jgi:esterase/lipase